MSAAARDLRTRLVRLARTPVPLPRWVPRRRPRRRDVKVLVRESGLPEVLCALVLHVVKRTRLWRSEQADVADELMGHLRDGLESGAEAAALVSSFGAPAVVAKLIRRAVRRKRPVAWRAWRRSLQGMGALLGLLVAVYLYGVARFFIGAPTISHDYLAEINAGARSVTPEERAWPLYRDAIVALRGVPEVAWDARPGSRGWTELVAGVEAHAPALVTVRAAAARPALGYVAGFAIDEADRVLWPDFRETAVPHAGLSSIALPYLVELRNLSRLLAVEMRRAAEAGDAALVEADCQAGLHMAEHAREVPTLICDLVSLGQLGQILDTFAEVLAAYPQIFSDAQLHRLAHEVAALDRQRLRVRFDGEKKRFRDFVQHMYSDDGNGDGHLTVGGMEWWDTFLGGKPGKQVNVLAPAVGLVVAGRREITEVYDRMVARAEAEAAKPLWEQDSIVVERDEEDMKDSLIRGTRYLFIAQLMPGFSRAGLHAEIAALRRDVVLVAIALELHHRRTGAWPESLDELVPDLLPAVPPDRFDGKPLRYRLIDGKPLLYSIGWDRNDDGGKATAGLPGYSRGDGDWILWAAP